MRAIATAEDDPRGMCGADGHRIFLECDGSSGRGVPVTNLQLATYNTQLATYNTHIATCSTHHTARNTTTAHCLDCKPHGYRCAYQSPSAFSRLIALSYLTDCLGRVSGSVCTALSNIHSGAQTKAKQTVESDRIDSTRLSTHFRMNTLAISLTVNAPKTERKPLSPYARSRNEESNCPFVVCCMQSCCILHCCASRLSYYCIVEYWGDRRVMCGTDRIGTCGLRSAAHRQCSHSATELHHAMHTPCHAMRSRSVW